MYVLEKRASARFYDIYTVDLSNSPYFDFIKLVKCERKSIDRGCPS